MDNHILAGNWKQFRDDMILQWGKLTDDDIDAADGRRDEMVGKIQRRYGLSTNEAQRQVTNFESRFKSE